MRISTKWRAAVARGIPFLLLTIVLTCIVSSEVAAQTKPPTISGSPTTALKVGASYNFRPTVSDPDTALWKLRFTIANKPAWASFNTSTGRLYGNTTAVGSWKSIRITVTDGTSSVSLPLFAIAVTTTGSGGSTNRPPVISGTPPTSVAVGSTYSFRPTASDPEGRTLTFSIANKPAWASFSTSNGTVSGTPVAANVGTYSNIVIRASDGAATASCPPSASR